MAKKAAETAVAACVAEGVPQNAECFICKSSIEGKGIVRGCACRGTRGVAHVACWVRQAEMSVKEMEEWGTGEGILKWSKCFDCGQAFHGAVKLALGWAMWKTYVGRPESDGYRVNALGTLASALRKNLQSAEALPMLEAELAYDQRYFSHDEEHILIVKSNIASCLAELGRRDEALVLKRKIYKRRVSTLGVSHEETMRNGSNLAASLMDLGLTDECTQFVRDQLLPVAQQSLGLEHQITLMLNQILAHSLYINPECTCDDLRFESIGRGAA